MTTAGIKPIRRDLFWLGVIGVAGTIGAASAHEWIQTSLYAVVLAVGFGGYCVVRGFVGGYRDARQGVAEEAFAAVQAAEESRRAAQAPCEIAVGPSVALPGEGYLYVIRFGTGVVKVGQTLDPRRRLSEHRRDAEAYSVAITKYWVSPSHVNYLDNEIELIGFCDGISVRAKREYFRGVDFNTVVRFAFGLTYYSNNPALTGAEQ